MKYKVCQTTNCNIVVGSELDFPKFTVGSEYTVHGNKFICTQCGDIVVLVNSESVIVLERVYEEDGYITDYRDIIEGEHVIFDITKRVIRVLAPMTLEALYKYVRHHKESEMIVCVGDNVYKFVNGWRLDGSESHRNIVDGEYSYESKILEFRL